MGADRPPRVAPPPVAQAPAARTLGADLPKALQTAVADAIRPVSPGADRAVDRLRISIPAGADAAAVARAVARAIRLELSRRR